MLKILIKNSIKAFFEPFKPKPNANGKKKFGRSVLLVLVYLYVAVMYSFMFYEQFGSVAIIYDTLKLGWLFFALSSISSAMIILAFTILSSEQYLYEAKDNDLLLSMPIKKEYLLIARSIPLFILGIFSSAITMISTLVAWIINVGFDLKMVINFIAVFPFFTIFNILLGCLFGWLISLISKKTGSKTLIKVIGSVIVIAALEGATILIENASTALITNSITLQNALKYIFPIYFLGKAIGDKSIVSLLIYIGVAGLMIYLIFKLLSTTYIGTITQSYNFKLKKYVKKRTKQVSSDFALLQREFRKLTRTFAYLANSAFSTIIIVIFTVTLLFKKNDINMLFEELQGFEYADSIGVIAAAVICLVLSTTLISACSVSLEGKNIWISHTLPVDTTDILLSKVFNQLIFTIPATLLISGVIIYLLQPNILVTMILILLPLGYSILISLVGVIVNVLIPKLDWTNEIVVIKQSAAILVVMAVNSLYIILPSALYYFVLWDVIDLDKFGMLFMLFTYLVVFLLYRVLVTDTKKKYERLG